MLSQQVRKHSSTSRAVSRTMSYAVAAVGGFTKPVQQIPQQGTNHTAKQAAYSSNGHAQYLERPRKQSPQSSELGNQRNEHVTREEHKPNTGTEEELVYVLTLRLTDSLAEPMNLMRRQYFPQWLNKTPAHLTLFHALPGSRFTTIDAELSQLSAITKPFFVSSGKPFRMRLGIGINVGKGYNKMKQLHECLRSQWMPYLSEQDGRKWMPHWTVMNKVKEEEKVNAAFLTVEKKMLQNVQEGQAVGLDLWRYDKGSWIFANQYNFKD